MNFFPMNISVVNIRVCGDSHKSRNGLPASWKLHKEVGGQSVAAMFIIYTDVVDFIFLKLHLNRYTTKKIMAKLQVIGQRENIFHGPTTLAEK